MFSYDTYISCWCSSWKGPPHFPHHLQSTVHLPGSCICLPTIAQWRAHTWCSRAHSTCEEKQVQKTRRDALLGADSHNWAVLRFKLGKIFMLSNAESLVFALLCDAWLSYIQLGDPWFKWWWVPKSVVTSFVPPSSIISECLHAPKISSFLHNSLLL